MREKMLKRKTESNSFLPHRFTGYWRLMKTRTWWIIQWIELLSWMRVCHYIMLQSLSEDVVAPVNNYLDIINNIFDWASLTKRRYRISPDHPNLSSSSVEDRIRYLDRHPSNEWAKQTKSTLYTATFELILLTDTLLKMSPTSLKVTNELLFRGAGLGTLAECLQLEYRVSQHFMRGHDFFEGVRALLVDKDKNPRWQPSKLEDVEVCFLAVLFSHVHLSELMFSSW